LQGGGERIRDADLTLVRTVTETGGGREYCRDIKRKNLMSSTYHEAKRKRTLPRSCGARNARGEDRILGSRGWWEDVDLGEKWRKGEFVLDFAKRNVGKTLPGTPPGGQSGIKK